MEIIKLTLQSTQDVNVIGILPQSQFKKTPFSADFGIVGVGQATKEHRHDEKETFIIVGGKGILESEAIKFEIEAGDVIHFEPFESHTLINTGTDNLSFLTIYWRDYKTAAVVASEKLAEAPQNNDIIYITAGPPTPNGDLHLGHLSGPCLGADVCTRYLKMKGLEVYNISWADDFQSGVVAKSKQLGLTAQQTADIFANDIKLTLDKMSIKLDLYSRPLHSPEYQKDLAIFLNNLWEHDAFYEEETLAFFDNQTRVYVNEGNVKGNCPYCGEKASANLCEECGHPNSGTDIIDPISTISNSTPISLPISRLHFPLDKYADKLKKHHDNAIMRSRLRALFDQMKTKGLLNFVISHPGTWGTYVPLDKFKNQTISSWFELAFAVLFYIREIERAKGLVMEDITIPENARIVHFFGYDNAFYYTTLFPSIYLAAFPDSPLKIDYVCNEFYLLDGLKFSTSKEHAIWGRQLLQEASADKIRFYLAYTRPESLRTNFSKEEFYEVIKNELEGNWNTWLVALNHKINSKFNGEAPEAGLWTHEHRNFYGRLQCCIKNLGYAYAIDTFSMQRASRELCELVREAINFANNEKYWSSTCEAEERTAIAIEITAAQLLALLASPLMPDFSSKLWSQLGNLGTPEEFGWPKTPPFAVPGTKINLCALL